MILLHSGRSRLNAPADMGICNGEESSQHSGLCDLDPPSLSYSSMAIAVIDILVTGLIFEKDYERSQTITLLPPISSSLSVALRSLLGILYDYNSSIPANIVERQHHLEPNANRFSI
ncbi:hypothetical protein TNCV_1350741 [Trichonephila clavipes]|nr:hypothetical protein TNCV_1350741 [Trichonephila clavipes]